jgi:hypothetical protein
MPAWLQIALPIFTALLGGGVGFGFGRLGKAMDRRQERKDADDAEAKAAQLRKPVFAVEHISGALYRLVNVGEADATRVHFSDRDESYAQIGGRPERIALGVHAAHEFNISVTDQLSFPARLLVMCDQFDEPAPVHIPR